MREPEFGRADRHLRGAGQAAGITGVQEVRQFAGPGLVQPPLRVGIHDEGAVQPLEGDLRQAHLARFLIYRSLAVAAASLRQAVLGERDREAPQDRLGRRVAVDGHPQVRGAVAALETFDHRHEQLRLSGLPADQHREPVLAAIGDPGVARDPRLAQARGDLVRVIAHLERDGLEERPGVMELHAHDGLRRREEVRLRRISGRPGLHQ